MDNDDPEEVLNSLRVGADQKFFNHFNWVWLKKIKGGVSDCCLVEDPCDWHAAFDRVTTTQIGNV